MRKTEPPSLPSKSVLPLSPSWLSESHAAQAPWILSFPSLPRSSYLYIKSYRFFFLPPPNLVTSLHLHHQCFFKSLNFSPEFQLVFRGVSLPNQWFLYFTILKHFPGSCLKLEMPRSYLHQVLIW